MKKFSLKKIIVSIAMMVTIFTAGAVGISQNTNTVDASSGNSIWKDTSNIPIYISPDLTMSEQKAAILSLNQWHSDVPQFSFTQVYSQDQAKIIYSSEKSDTTGRTTRSTSKTAGTQQWYITKAVVRVNIDKPLYYNSLMQRTYMHETGHALGLNDSYDKNDETKSVMYGTNTTAALADAYLPQNQNRLS
ncbi:hypothetical protein [Companilactobacillus mishanensis]|uniref:hypothetical protein n=1 Tax=Companilactobacillus mishanensis TaxID=2486008 RepID=UPI001297E753|nr:hypothetical protein [Companilactobacillus mishanensis]MQS90329.1 hypothetical protein [Companilactobacillus mishanensis]